jgi:hypothetical protein
MYLYIFNFLFYLFYIFPTINMYRSKKKDSPTWSMYKFIVQKRKNQKEELEKTEKNKKFF